MLAKDGARPSSQRTGQSRSRSLRNSRIWSRDLFNVSPLLVGRVSVALLLLLCSPRMLSRSYPSAIYRVWAGADAVSMRALAYGQPTGSPSTIHGRKLMRRCRRKASSRCCGYIQRQGRMSRRRVNEDQVAGRIKQAKGEVNKLRGEVLGDGSLEQKGKIESAAGKIQTAYGDLKADLEKAE